MVQICQTHLPPAPNNNMVGAQADLLHHQRGLSDAVTEALETAERNDDKYKKLLQSFHEEQVSSLTLAEFLD